MRRPRLLAGLALASWLSLLAAGQTATSGPANNEQPFASMLNSAVINGSASLACDIAPASPEDSVALVLWYKDDSLAPIYSVDARKASSLEAAKTSVDRAYAARASFDTRAKPAQLRLERVQADDEADYRCRVDFRRGRTVNTIISLRVVVPPGELRIRSPQLPQLARLDGLVGPFNEGAELALVCEAQGGRPRPQLTWRRDFNVLDEARQQLDKDLTTSELRIGALNKHHLLSIFTCQALSPTPGGAANSAPPPLQASITLDLNLKPQEVLVRPLQHEPLIAGQTVAFECLAKGSRPHANIHWLFQGQRHEAPMSVDQQQSSSRLTLTLQRSFNGQQLTCVADNPRIGGPNSPTGPDAGARHTIKLDVHYPPQLSVRLDEPRAGQLQLQQQLQQQQQQQQNQHQLLHSPPGPHEGPAQRVQLQEGNDIYLVCAVEANPRPAKPPLWRFNARPLLPAGSPATEGALPVASGEPSAATGAAPANSAAAAAAAGSGNALLISNQSLVMRKVGRQQAGAYTCEASNAHGAAASRPLELDIRHAPVCATDDVLVLEASAGQTLALDCSVLANPTSAVHYGWFAWGAPGDRHATPTGAAGLQAWARRDSPLDEQLDELSATLRLKLRPELAAAGHAGPLATIKCKAKNEIGLQQRACLFQVRRARAPRLRHSCSLAAPGATPTGGLQVICERAPPSAKAGAGQPSRGPARLGAGDGARAAAAAARARAHLPRFRRLRAPSWLLVELYRQLGPAAAAAASGEQGAAQHPNNQAADEELAEHELVGQLVVGARRQLAAIRATLEAARPGPAGGRSAPLHYLAAEARPEAARAAAGAPPGPALNLSGGGELGRPDLSPGAYLNAQAEGAQLDKYDDSPDSDKGPQNDAAEHEHKHRQADDDYDGDGDDDDYYDDDAQKDDDDDDQHDEEHRHEYDDPGDDWRRPHQKGPHYGRHAARGRPQTGPYPAGRLARAFNFSLAGLLEPGRAYKLLVYGQNAINRTRDWQVIRARGPGWGAGSGAPAAAAAGQQKSLVMRSDAHEEPSSSAPPPQPPPAPQSEQVTRGPPSAQLGPGEPLPGGPPRAPSGADPAEQAAASGRSLAARWHQLSSYGDAAVAYARHKPLLAVPMAVTLILSLLLLLTWTSAALVALARRGGRPQPASGAQQQQQQLANCARRDHKAAGHDDHSNLDGEPALDRKSPLSPAESTYGSGRSNSSGSQSRHLAAPGAVYALQAAPPGPLEPPPHQLYHHLCHAPDALASPAGHYVQLAASGLDAAGLWARQLGLAPGSGASSDSSHLHCHLAAANTDDMLAAPASRRQARVAFELGPHCQPDSALSGPNTADSGHESPATTGGDTTTNSASGQQLGAASLALRQASANPAAPQCQLQPQFQLQRQLGPGDLLMLMQLPAPTSGRHSALAANQAASLERLHNNHQMATSFGTCERPAAARPAKRAARPSRGPHSQPASCACEPQPPDWLLQPVGRAHEL